MKNFINWLLDGEPFIEYRTRLDLMKQSEGDPKVVYARKRMIQDEKIQVLLNELTNWPGEVLSSHKSASQPFHKLSFIAELD